MSESQAFDSVGYEYPFDASEEHVVIVAAEWHRDVVDPMVADAMRVLKNYGVGSVRVEHVPGCFELPYAASLLMNSPDVKPGYLLTTGVMCMGCLVEGDTPHFDYISRAVSQQLAALSTGGGALPLVFGVLTTHTKEQAEARVNGVHSKKGVELAVALMKIFAMRNTLLLDDDERDYLMIAEETGDDFNAIAHYVVREQCCSSKLLSSRFSLSASRTEEVLEALCAYGIVAPQGRYEELVGRKTYRVLLEDEALIEEVLLSGQEGDGY